MDTIEVRRLSMYSGTHLPVLIKLVSKTKGPILEIGGGLFSTPFLHWACFARKRELVTYENNPNYFNLLKQYESDFHKVQLVEDWDKMPIERLWDIALVDHAPAKRRKIDIARLANFAKYIVIHDSEGRFNRVYKYQLIYPLFKYQFHFRDIRPHTSVLSNFVNLNNLKL